MTAGYTNIYLDISVLATFTPDVPAQYSPPSSLHTDDTKHKHMFPLVFCLIFSHNTLSILMEDAYTP